MRDKKISDVMREMARRRWQSDEQRQALGQRSRARMAALTSEQRAAIGVRLAEARARAKARKALDSSHQGETRATSPAST